MSVFDYPRINVYGTIQLNPGTANNDDYAASAVLPSSWQALAGEPLGLIDSKNVRARTYGMSDDNFIAWVKKTQTFSPGSQRIIPAEWNYYGDMSSTSLDIKVCGVQAGSSGVQLDCCLGAQVTLYGSITDINPEGSPPATQFFIEELTLAGKDSKLIHAKFDVKGDPRLLKGVGQWINFYRNVNIVADGGAGSYVYQALPGAKVEIPGWEALGASGVIFRYYLFNAQLANPEGATNAGIEKLYEKGSTNPKNLELVGTFAPLFPDEKIVAAPSGRLMIANTPNIPTPTAHNNGGGVVALAPAVLQQDGDVLSADFSGTFPDNYQGDQNPKYDFGPVTLALVSGNDVAEVGSVDYADTAAGNACGWLFEFDVSGNDTVKKLLEEGDATFKLLHPLYGEVLGETDYYFVSNQQSVYAEQHGSGEVFLNNGSEEPVTVSVFHRGQELKADEVDITVWQYRSIPLQAPGDAEPIAANFKPGEPLRVDTCLPGNFLFTFTVNGDDNPSPAGYPPKSYATFMNPPFVTNAPQISLRILPNEDYSRYYVDPCAKEPVGNELLTFDVVRDQVLRVYYLLYPVMSFLRYEPDAQRRLKILELTQPALWLSTSYMPRTRDLSASRRTLLQAWCRKGT